MKWFMDSGHGTLTTPVVPRLRSPRRSRVLREVIPHRHGFSEDSAAVARPPVVVRSRRSRATPPYDFRSRVRLDFSMARNNNFRTAAGERCMRLAISANERSSRMRSTITRR